MFFGSSNTSDKDIDSPPIVFGLRPEYARIARLIQRIFKLSGRILSGAYHAHILRCPSEVRRALAYVLLNAGKHAKQLKGTPPPAGLDAASSSRWFDGFTRVMGLIFVAILIAYLVASVILDRRKQSAAAKVHSGEAEAIETHEPLVVSLALAILGIAGVVAGAKLLVTGGSDLARAFGISETVIGLSIVAVGTSLPELVTSIMSALKGKADVALGNVLGSNVFNILGIMGVSAAVYPFSIIAPAATEGTKPLDVEAMSFASGNSLVTMQDMGALALSVILLALFAYTGRRLARWEGAVLLGGYALYMAMSFNLLPHIGGAA